MKSIDAQLRKVLRPSGAIAVALAVSLAGAGPVGAADGPDFTVSPKAPLAGQSVTFTATDIRASDSVRWDFQSDGVFDATGKTVEHVYASAGERSVLMRVTRSGSDPIDVMKAVSVKPASTPQAPPDQPPVASFTFYPREPLTGDSVEFISTASDAESPIASHDWDLDGDGEFDDASGVTAAFTFSAPGDHTVGLRVTDGKGGTGIGSRTFTVGARLTSLSRLGLMSPFPVVRIIGRSGPSGARIRMLMVRSAPRGAKVTVRCRGEGCRRRLESRIVRVGRLRFRSFERLMRAGARIQIFVTRSGSFGKYTSFKIRRARPPLRRDLCVTSVRAKPGPCPSS